MTPSTVAPCTATDQPIQRRYASRFYMAALLLCGALFYVLNYFTPFNHDDFAYVFYYAADSDIVRPSSTPITSVWQILPSMWHHYLAVNGRFSAHVVVQLFCGILGKGIFNVVNTLVFMLFLDLLTRIIVGRRSMAGLLMNYLAAMMVFPFPGQTMLWQTGSINYLWPVTFTLLLFSKIEAWSVAPTRKWKHVAVAFAAMCVGNMQESVSLGVTAGMVIYFFLNRSLFKGYNRSMLVGYLLGALFIALSPGSSHRVENEVLVHGNLFYTMLGNTYMVVMSFFHTIVPVLVLLAFVVLAFKRKFMSAVRPCIYAWSFVMMLLFVLALGMPDERIQYGLCVMGYIFLLQGAARLVKRVRYERAISVALAMVVAVVSGVALADVVTYNREIKHEEQLIVNAPQDCVVPNELTDVKSRYANFHYAGENPYGLHNRAMSFYYHKNYIQVLPDEMYRLYQHPHTVSSLKRDHIASTDTTVIADAYIMKTAEGDFWVIPLQRELKMNKDSRVVCRHVVPDLLPRQRFARTILGTIDGITQERSYPLQLGSRPHLIVSRPADALRFDIMAVTDTVALTLK